MMATVCPAAAAHVARTARWLTTGLVFGRMMAMIFKGLAIAETWISASRFLTCPATSTWLHVHMWAIPRLARLVPGAGGVYPARPPCCSQAARLHVRMWTSPHNYRCGASACWRAGVFAWRSLRTVNAFGS